MNAGRDEIGKVTCLVTISALSDVFSNWQFHYAAFHESQFLAAIPCRIGNHSLQDGT